MGSCCSRFSAHRRKILQRLQDRQKKMDAKDERRRMQRSDEGQKDEDVTMAMQMFIIDNPFDIEQCYDVEKTKIGEGSFARVCVCTNKSTGMQRAVKICKKNVSKEMDGKFEEELNLMKRTDHPNIVKLFEHLEDDDYFYMIMELCPGGELYDRLLQVGHFSEPQVAIIMQQILRGVMHMHSRRVCHRDLKIENLLLRTACPIETNRIKICDFGEGTLINPGTAMTTKCGAPFYVSPQVLSGHYDQTCDLWTVGVIMYILLAGYPPFYGVNDADVLHAVHRRDFSFNSADWKHISQDAMDLIEGLLKYEPMSRLTPRAALDHDFFGQKLPHRPPPLKLKYIDNIRMYGRYSLLKKASLLMMAYQLDEEYTKPLIDTFVWMDTSGDGDISSEEVVKGLKRCGLEDSEMPFPEEIKQIMQAADLDGSGEMNYTEFVAATLDRKVYTREEVMWSAFRTFDRNGLAKFGAEDLQEVWSHDKSKDACENLIREVTGRSKAHIYFDDFVKIIKADEKPHFMEKEWAKMRPLLRTIGQKPKQHELDLPNNHPIQDGHPVIPHHSPGVGEQDVDKLEEGGDNSVIHTSKANEMKPLLPSNTQRDKSDFRPWRPSMSYSKSSLQGLFPPSERNGSTPHRRYSFPGPSSQNEELTPLNTLEAITTEDKSTIDVKLDSGDLELIRNSTKPVPKQEIPLLNSLNNEMLAIHPSKPDPATNLPQPSKDDGSSLPPRQRVTWRVGSIAELHGCSKTPELNGAEVRLVEQVPGKTGKTRWKIELLSDPARRFAVKESNLRDPSAQQLSAEEEEEELEKMPQLTSGRVEIAVLHDCTSVPEKNGAHVKLIQYRSQDGRWEIQTLGPPAKRFAVKEVHLRTVDGRPIPPPHGSGSAHEAWGGCLKSASSMTSVRSCNNARGSLARGSSAKGSSARGNSARGCSARGSSPGRRGTAETQPAASQAVIKGSKQSDLNGTIVRLIRFHEDTKRWAIQPLDPSGAPTKKFLIKSSNLEGIDGPVSPA